MVKKKRYNLFFHFALLLGLTGCGGSSDSNNATQDSFEQVSEAVAISTRDMTTAVYENTSNEISLASYISMSDDSSPKLADVKSVTDSTQCETVSVNPDDVSFVVDTENAGLCVYEYTVSDENSNVTETAYVQMSVTGADAPLVSSGNFEPLSAVAELGGDAVEITLTRPDMNDSDGNPITFTLSNDVTVMGSGLAATNAGSTQDTLIYTPGSNDGDEGVTRVFYSYTSADGIILVGTVDIAVSTNILNRAPTADNWVYIEKEEIENGQTYTSMLEGTKIEVDLTNVLTSINSSGNGVYSNLIGDSDNPTNPYNPNATDNEDTLYLSQVRVANADVCLGPDPSGAEEDSCDDNITSATEFNNLTFRFRASSAGIYYVTYVVSDQNGGYAIGSIGFHVEGSWPNVIVTKTKDVFAAPLSLQAATKADYQITGVASEDSRPSGNGVDNVPTYTWSDAYAICLARGGNLPTRDQWDAFYDQEGNAFNGTNDLDWPIAKNYFTLDTHGVDTNLVYVYNPVTGSTSELVESGIDNGPITYLGYLACIDKTPSKLEITNSILYTDVLQQLTVNYYTSALGDAFEYTSPLYWYVSEPEDSTLEMMPNIGDGTTGNVQLDKYTGEFNATEDGFINISAETPLGRLTTNKDIEVISNLLAKGGLDLTFESYEAIFPPGSNLCVGEDYAIQGDSWSNGLIEFDLSHTYGTIAPTANIVHNCLTAPEGYTYLEFSPAFSQGTDVYSYLQIQKDSNNVSLKADQDYKLTFWYKGENIRSISARLYESNYSNSLDYIVGNTLKSSYIVDSTHGWDKYELIFDTVTRDYSNVSLEFHMVPDDGVATELTLASFDDIVLIPIN